MTFSNAGCCAEVLKQQQLEAIQHCTECDQSAVKPLPTPTKNCTVVENGRVVVRPQKAPADIESAACWPSKPE